VSPADLDTRGRMDGVTPPWLTALRLTLALAPLAPIELTDFAGTVLRGGFGVAFKRISCPLRRQPCETCLLAPSCVYQQVFDTPVPAGAPLLPPGGKAPHPYIIDPPAGASRFHPGEEMAVGLTLIGRAASQLPYFLYAFRRLGEMGLGRGRGQFRLAAATLHPPGEPPRLLYRDDDPGLAHPVTPFPLPALTATPPAVDHAGAPPLTLTFATPLRLKEEGHFGARPTFPLLIKHLLRRAALLAACHGAGPPAWDHRAWIAAAGAVETRAEQLQWRDLARYSTRQHAAMRLGGWTGTVRYHGPWTPFRPLLAAAELLHVGQAITFGLGRVVCSPRDQTNIVGDTVLGASSSDAPPLPVDAGPTPSGKSLP